MAAGARVKVDADTSAFSAKMNAARQKMAGIAQVAQGALGPFGMLASSAGVIAAAGATAMREWNLWLDTVREGNSVSQELARNAQNVASGVGMPGYAPMIRGAIERAAMSGGASIQQTQQGVSAFTGTAPDASMAQINRAADAFQGLIGAGVSEPEARTAMELAGRLITAGISETKAFGMGLYLVQKLGKDASRAVQLIPRLLASKIDEDDAIAMAIAGARVGDRSGAATVVEEFMRGGARGGSAALGRMLTRRSSDLGMKFRVFQEEVQAIDFTQNIQEAERKVIATNPEFAAQLGIQNLRNRTQINTSRGQAAAGLEQELQQAEQELLVAESGRTGTIVNLAADIVTRNAVTAENAQERAVNRLQVSRSESQFTGLEAIQQLIRQQIRDIVRFRPEGQQ